MCSKLFEQSFITDSLQTNDGLERKEQIVSCGTRVILHQTGIVEIIPPIVTGATRHLLVTCSVTETTAPCFSFIDSLLNDILSGFQKVKTHTLFIVNKTQHDQLSQELLAKYVMPLWDGVHSRLKLHLDISASQRASLYSTVAFSPKVRKPARSRKLFEFLALSHIDAVVLHNAPSETLCWTLANQFEVDTAKIEFSVPVRVSGNERKNEGFELTLRDFMSREKSEHIPKTPKYFRVTRTIVKQNISFLFLFSDELPNFTRFKHGEVFGMDGDKPLMAKNDGEAVLYPDSHVGIDEVAAIMVFDVVPRYEENQLIYD